jgi:hypothetical protein
VRSGVWHDRVHFAKDEEGWINRKILAERIASLDRQVATTRVALMGGQITKRKALSLPTWWWLTEIGILQHALSRRRIGSTLTRWLWRKNKREWIYCISIKWN